MSDDGTVKVLQGMARQLRSIELRQTTSLATDHQIVDLLTIIRDQLAVLTEWLQNPPKSDLPALLAALTAAFGELSGEMRGMRADLMIRMDALPAAIARAMQKMKDDGVQ